MKAIRFIGTLAVAGALAGCAGKTSLDPGASASLTKPVLPVEPQKTMTAPARAVPERIVRTQPVAVAIPAAPLRTIPVAPVTPERVATAPLYEPQTVPAPVAIETALPVYEPIEESVDVAVAPEPVRIPTQPVAEYRAIGALDAAPVAPALPTPTYETVAALPAPVPAPTTRTMAPIRDDPKDGRNGRRAANNETRQHARKGYRRNAAIRAGGRKAAVRSNFTPAFGMKLEQAALGRLNPRIRYDARYVSIGYPWGDVDEATGVCTDVVIRSYRKLGIDLQELVHEDMKRAFHAYPSKRIYGLKRPDPNIDHRRVVNLEAFFERTGASIPVGTAPDDFKPGDVVTWRLSGNEPHVGIVVSDRDPKTGYPLVVHNLGAGVRKDDLISLDPPVGHFRFAPDRQTVVAQLVTKR